VGRSEHGRTAWLLVFAAVLGLGCGSARLEPPAGFAPYEASGAFRAVSPEAVVYRVRTEPNEPRADLPFWKEALERRMIDGGYRVLAKSDVSAAGGEPGFLLELAAPYGAQDFGYLLAIFVRDDRIVIVESAGEALRLQAQREAVLAAIARLDVAGVR